MKRTLIRQAAALLLVSLLAAAMAACLPMAPDQQPAQQPAQEAAQQAAQAAPEGAKTVTMYVGPELVDCVGVGPQKCYQVKAAPEDDWQMFYDKIQGFEYEPGYLYQLTVRIETVANPPADASAYAYTLVEVVSKTPVDETGAVAVPPTEPAATPGPATPEMVTNTVALEGAPWQLVAVAGADAVIQEPIEGTVITVQFADGMFGGNSGCNNYMGVYETSGQELSLQLGGSTMMACSESIMDKEMAYLTALQSAGYYRITGDTLQIASPDGEVLLTYVLLQPASLTGTNWEVISYNNGREALVSPLTGSSITLLFGEDGAVSGNSGCNNYMASFAVEGEHITIGPAAATRMMCSEPEGIMDQESEYLAALSNAATYEVTGDELAFFDETGTRMVQALAAPVEAEAAQEVTSEDATTEDQITQAEAAQQEAALASGMSAEWVDVLANLEYESYVTESGVAPLVNGEYSEPAAPGSASEVIVLLTQFMATGDLNGDGVEGAAVVLASESGGSGVFIDLAAVVVEDGVPINVAITPLGDRVQVNSLTIQDGQIVVDLVVQGPGDPMCCPTQQVVETYELQGNDLVKM